jgi:hypothetical protein
MISNTDLQSLVTDGLISDKQFLEIQSYQSSQKSSSG